MRGFWAVIRKEFKQMLRDRGTLGFALTIPVFELFLFGVIDTNVKHIPAAVFDQSRTAESRQLVTDFVNTSRVDVVVSVRSREELRREIVAGRVSIGIEIPPDYARRRLEGRSAEVLILIDGSDSALTASALSAANGIALSRSVEELSRKANVKELPIKPFPLLLFNPDSRSANLLIPGLVAILLTFSGTILAAFSIVRERERGTLEQLMVTPVSPAAVVVGKLLPYLALGYVQLVIILSVMWGVFRVPVNGSLTLLLALSFIYLFALLALGLVISSRAKTQMEAIQGAQAFLLPSIFLSGYVFPLSSLPEALRWVSQVLPATHFIAISRGIIIRGASFADLWQNVLALVLVSTVLIVGSTRAFHKTIG